MSSYANTLSNKAVVLRANVNMWNEEIQFYTEVCHKEESNILNFTFLNFATLLHSSSIFRALASGELFAR